MKLEDLYYLLLEIYGYQNWWPVDEEYHKIRGTDKREEIVIGAILTQNTNWNNVEKALKNLKEKGELSLKFLREVDLEELKELIKPAGFYNQKAKKLKAISHALDPIDKVKTIKREELLRVYGVGRETADVILLYAGERLYFVIDKYTQRFLKRFLNIEGNYEDLRNYFEKNLPKDIIIYKEFHALIDEHAKKYCKGTLLCGECPIRNRCSNEGPSF